MRKIISILFVLFLPVIFSVAVFADIGDVTVDIPVYNRSDALAAAVQLTPVLPTAPKPDTENITVKAQETGLLRVVFTEPGCYEYQVIGPDTAYEAEIYIIQNNGRLESSIVFRTEKGKETMIEFYKSAQKNSTNGAEESSSLQSRPFSFFGNIQTGDRAQILIAIAIATSAFITAFVVVIVTAKRKKKSIPEEMKNCTWCGGHKTLHIYTSEYNGHRSGYCEKCGMKFIE